MAPPQQQTPQEAGKPLRVRLETFGNPRETYQWETGEVDYVTRLGLSAADVPELLAIARKWAEPIDWPDDPDYVAGYAPIHAWRGLAQLRSTEAIQPLLGMMEPLDAADDDWYLGEFPHVFAWIGPPSLGPLREYLAEGGHTLYPRVAASDGLKELAKRHPETREDVVEAICQTLSRFQEADPSFNGFLVGDLLDLKAVEAAELIERAHASDCVDVSISGNWNDIRKELGVEGLGLVPPDIASQTWTWLPNAPSDRDDEEGSYVGEGDGEVEADEEEDYLAEEVTAPIRSSPKVGRNEPCPCGSGKKHKKCCGR